MERECFQRKKNQTPSKEKLRREIVLMMSKMNLWREELSEEIPTYWDNFKNFVIFNSKKFFIDSCWKEAGPELWECVSSLFSEKSIALQGNIKNDDFRSPNATVVYGQSPWVEFLDNGISYTWNVEHTMFCTGNISERHRIAGLDCRNQVTVDMFAGIGYFTLPYLTHAGADRVIACEWNPMSGQALRTNLERNGVAGRCVVVEGDVRTECPRGIADQVNLGLIPSCEEYWLTAAEILKPTGGVMRVHGNVTSITSDVHCKECARLMEHLPHSTGENGFVDFQVKMFDELIFVSTHHSENGQVKWKRLQWFIWGIHVSHSFCKMLNSVTKTNWNVTPVFLHRVKTYAPHIDHLVVDICCRNELDQGDPLLCKHLPDLEQTP